MKKSAGFLNFTKQVGDNVEGEDFINSVGEDFR